LKKILIFSSATLPGPSSAKNRVGRTKEKAGRVNRFFSGGPTARSPRRFRISILSFHATSNGLKQRTGPPSHIFFAASHRPAVPYGRG
jgi:hypothetical protein